MNRKTVYEIVDNKTGKVLGTFSFSVRVRLKLVDLVEYKETHGLLNRIEGETNE